ncbi:hypothetical protein [Sphingomonas guangdongensis]|nr:hypothetical protein [Sphingomonas guangdongensis]
MRGALAALAHIFQNGGFGGELLLGGLESVKVRGRHCRLLN